MIQRNLELPEMPAICENFKKKIGEYKNYPHCLYFYSISSFFGI